MKRLRNTIKKSKLVRLVANERKSVPNVNFQNKLANSLTISSPVSKSMKTIWRFSESARSEEHTSELQSRGQLVCRLLLVKKKDKHNATFSLNNLLGETQ